MYTTTNWYGLNEYYKRICKLLHNISESDVCDLMYILTCDERYFTNIQRHIWVLVVGYTVISIYGYIGFSRLEY